MLPIHGDKYEVAIEFMASDPLPDYERIRHNASLQSKMFIAYWPTAFLKITILVICFILLGTCTLAILQKDVILRIFRSWLWRTRIRMDG